MTLGLPRRARPDGSLLRDGAFVAMRRPPSWPSVALCLLGSVAACSPASDVQSDSGQPSPVMAQVSESGERAGPALPYIVDDVCPAEGCAVGTWEACGPVPGSAEAGDRGTEVFRLSLEESFTVHNGRMRVTEPGPVVIQKSTTVPQGDSTVVFAVGDTAYVLHYVGEGRFNVWYRGAEVETRDFWAWTPPQVELLHEATN